jgi:hypothetical protein
VHLLFFLLGSGFKISTGAALLTFLFFARVFGLGALSAGCLQWNETG